MNEEEREACLGRDVAPVVEEDDAAIPYVAADHLEEIDELFEIGLGVPLLW